MRFLMLNWRDPKNPRAGGAERVTLSYMAALAARGHETYWFSNRYPGAPPEESIDGIRIVRRGGVGSSILEARSWIHDQGRFDLVIDQHHGIPWYAPWWCGTHCLAFMHEVLGPIWDTFYRPPWSHIGKWQELQTLRLYQEIPFLTVSEATRTCLREQGVRHVHLLLNGVDTPALPELEPKALGEPLRLVAASRLAPNKRVDHALRALQTLRQRGVDASLTVVGTGEVEASLKQLGHELGLAEHVTFAGLLSEELKDRQLREAHLLLHTSVREGWGLNVIEANALGTPAVVYPVPGLAESTVHDQTGLLAAEESPESLAEQVQLLLADQERYQRLRQAAWERAKTLHWTRVLPAACDWLEARARGEPLEPDNVSPDDRGGGGGGDLRPQREDKGLPGTAGQRVRPAVGTPASEPER